jgi:5-methylthioadenosine/S-adenosylhomocysteine deaminase
MTVYEADWVLPVDAPPIEGGAVAIENGRIAAIGTGLGTPDERFEEAAILPGFVNAHSHLEYAAYAGFGDSLAFAPWIGLHITRKAMLDIGEMEAIARLGAAESLASGITTVGDASYSGAAASACAELGLRGIVYIEVFGSGIDQIEERYHAHGERVADALSERVRLGVSPHSVYSASLQLWTAAAALDVPMATHFAESAAEVEWVRDRTGPFAEVLPVELGGNSIRTLADHGLLGSRLTAAHCVYLHEEELRLLVEHDVAVAHCPRSNALLGCGIAPLADLRAAGLRVGIGTDSPASTPSFDMFDELRTAISFARARDRRADALTAAAALELATIGSARALGLDHEIGSLTPGKRADLTVLSLSGSPYLPWEDPAVAVVLGGSPERIVLTATDGQVRYKKGEVEWHELRRRAASARKRMLSAAQPASAATPR